MSRLSHPYALRAAALVLAGTRHAMLRRLVWFAWASDNPNAAGVRPDEARKAILRGLRGYLRWRMALAGGGYLVMIQNGRTILVWSLVLFSILLFRFVSLVMG